jgi:hypothetical protein
MKGLLKSIGTKAAATSLLLTAFNAAVLAEGNKAATDSGMSGGAVVGGVFVVIALFVLLSTKGSHNRTANKSGQANA